MTQYVGKTLYSDIYDLAISDTDCIGCGALDFEPAPGSEDGRVCVECHAKCPHCLHQCYPYYGCAPHDSFRVIDGDVKVVTDLHPRETWPDNFVEDPEVPGCGTYTHCPVCGHGDPKP